MTDNPPKKTTSPDSELQLTPAQFAERISKSTRTLRDWDKRNLFKARRTPGNEPFYLEEDVTRYFAGDNTLLTA